MTRIIKSLGFAVLVLVLANCKRDDDVKVPPPRDRGEVYTENLSTIETFLKTKSLTVTDEGISFTDVQEGSPEAIWSQTAYPLQSVVLKNDSREDKNILKRLDDNIEYKVYYMIINEGGGEHPVTFDNIFSAYGVYDFNKNLIEEGKYGFWSSFPQTQHAPYSQVISGYRQIVTKIKTATGVIENPDGTYTFENPGRIVVFIPSGLGYFNSGQGRIGAYQPIIFDIKLISRKEADHDNDGILSKYEDVNGNGDLWDDDTDGDGKPDFVDVDDDADGKTTREEITYEITDEEGNVVKKLYEFDEIPNCPGGTVKKHLDKSCQ